MVFFFYSLYSSRVASPKSPSLISIFSLRKRLPSFKLHPPKSTLDESPSCCEGIAVPARFEGDSTALPFQ